MVMITGQRNDGLQTAFASNVCYRLPIFFATSYRIKATINIVSALHPAIHTSSFWTPILTIIIP